LYIKRFEFTTSLNVNDIYRWFLLPCSSTQKIDMCYEINSQTIMKQLILEREVSEVLCDTMWSI